ncbi:hypothetical protein MKX08_007984 [Trichoderma sp. CBMAI-0020]|nr:hypothetical protein MKX08_007984 [Trichoderma sp. CBMAI-0020]WOD45612.1 hypothetical protein [Trichoderma atroviride]
MRLVYLITVVIPYGKSHCEHFTDNPMYRDGMKMELLPLILTNAGLLSGALLTTCHSLFIQSQNPGYKQLAIQYKVACLDHLNNAIRCETDFIADATVIQALLLASNDTQYAAGERTTAQLHYNAALQMRGYKVRGTVRNLTPASWLVDDLFKDAAVAGNFELTLVSDFGLPNAFKNAVKGVSAIAHIATPNNFDPDPSKVFPVTVGAATSILKAAVSESSVKRFAYTSSVAAAATQRPGNHTHVGRDTWNNWAIEIANAPPPYEASREPAVYSAAKAKAEKAVWDFLEADQPPFAINVVSPFATIGPVLHPNQPGATSLWIKELLQGDSSSTSIVPNFYTVHVHDAALLHIAALLDTEVNGCRLQAWAEPANWNDLLRILRKLCPNNTSVASDVPNGTDIELTTDTTECIRLLKKWGDQDEFKTTEEAVQDTLTHWKLVY